MAKPRSEVFIKDEVGIYHCLTKIVRGRFLFGLDAFTGKNYNYRKDWIRKEFRRIAGEMAIQILDYAVLASHLHAVLRNRPDIVAQWSDAEVVRRWWRLCPRRRKPNGKPAKPRESELKALREKVDELRERLSDISWMMRLALQRVAQRANKEDDVEGRFFAKRFDCKRLEDEVSLLNCSLYVDLNWVHAGIAETPEESTYTSAFERIRAVWIENAQTLSGEVDEDDRFDGDWLAPIFIDERAEAYVSAKDVPPERTLEEANSEPPPANELNCEGEAKETTLYNALGARRVSNRGFLPITLKRYLELLDLVGRRIRSDKRGAIPEWLPPILERLKLEPKAWFEEIVSLFDASDFMCRKPA